MHVNDLNCDILHRIFAICSLSYNKTSGSYKDYLNLRPVSSVCRYWRPIALPHLYERVFVFHRHGEIHTNAMAIFAGNHFSYVRKLEINVMDSIIDEVEITSVLNRAGIGRAAWPQIKKLEIANTVSKDQLVEAATGFTCSHESVVGYFAKHLPGLSEVKFSQDIWDEYRFVSRSEFPCRLVNGLADTYSTQLHKLHLGIYIDCMSQGLCFPQQLTHMDISMDGYEMGILPSIFAPCLRYLKIRDASSDITWGWFDSGSGADVWFASLTELVVEFDPRPELYRQTYRTGVLFAVELAEYYSDYCEVAKRPHFPALERLTVTSYPYDDHGFYKLFEGCPLKHADIESPRSTQCHVPPQLIANLTNMNMVFDYCRSYYEAEDGHQEQEGLEGLAYEESLAKLMSLPTTAHTVRLRASTYDVVSLPEAIAWADVQRLELGFTVNVLSLLGALAELPGLRYLQFKTSPSALCHMCAEDAASAIRAGRQCGIVSTGLEFADVSVHGASELSCDGLCYLLSSLLLHAPSLLKLRLNKCLVGAAELLLSESTKPFELKPQRLEVVEGAW